MCLLVIGSNECALAFSILLQPWERESQQALGSTFHFKSMHTCWCVAHYPTYFDLFCIGDLEVPEVHTPGPIVVVHQTPNIGTTLQCTCQENASLEHWASICCKARTHTNMQIIHYANWQLIQDNEAQDTTTIVALIQELAVPSMRMATTSIQSWESKSTKHIYLSIDDNQTRALGRRPPA